ncbi:MAG: UDP-N-acetylglucosamine--N-acetylmuramyl-(pentapeptide) pyrophosphoryl-undecaprenol N-acetylglucosamine transferase [Candidatus Zambryskibacteria bacterium]|nr:UDP-N-acetylglucosamine--N-acetylmuramyl-(pentapeptide) pyrophosphoryl-undecaprenol N-acetylglucosamine transferase [Candidatus Zambryskibacteria bacterium]
MKIIFTGGGTGGHFYPIIAIAESIQKIAREKKLIAPEMYFFAPNPYDQGILYDHNIKYKKVTAGKMRRYFSLLNVTDFFKTIWGVLNALFDVFNIYPDVVFSKGGYGSFPAVMAARILRIPIFIHESDSVPGRTNKWAGKFAERIAISFKEAASNFPEEKLAFTGQPILEEKLESITENSLEFFGFDKSFPTLFIMGGSQGAEIINNIVLDTLPELVKTFQIIHQTGPANFEVVRQSADAILLENPDRSRYKPLGYLNNLEMRMAAGAANLIVSRGGSTIFEIASWGMPSIIIPISDSNGDHQTKNAFIYAKSEACSVLKESNLKPNIFLAEIRKIMENQDLREKMVAGAKKFFKPGGADQIARELFSIVLSHEKLS